MLSKTFRVIQSEAKNLTECSGRVPARDPSALRFVGMTETNNGYGLKVIGPYTLNTKLYPPTSFFGKI